MGTTSLILYGTNEPLPERREVRWGPVDLDIENGNVRSLRVHGVELIRAISYPVRDADWGSATLVTDGEELECTSDCLSYVREFHTDDGQLKGRFELRNIGQGALEATVTFRSEKDFFTNRTGFTLLHPIKGLAGAPVSVKHSDGASSSSFFPLRISPGQPVRDIAGLDYAIEGVGMKITFEGDIFEMEDQRNWSDASYKTYCRPLGLPFPYTIPAGKSVTQKIVLAFSGRPDKVAAPAKPRLAIATGPEGILPEFRLAVERDWKIPPGIEADSSLDALPALVRLDLTEPPPDFAWISQIAGELDLELIVADSESEIDRQLSALHQELDRQGRLPRHVMALPKAYLKSYQPDGAWPETASPESAAFAARRHFPDASIGGGVLTNFTELNRRPPETHSIDYVTFSSTAIVHAADDRSVFETLETLPQIIASAKHISSGKPLRLGLVAIGMRTNPYGSDVASNPRGVRIAMATRDPRARALVGAAFMLGVAAAVSDPAVESVAIAAPTGPFGLLEASGDSQAPLHRVPAFLIAQALSELSGLPRLIVSTDDARLHALAARLPAGGTRVLVANGSSDQIDVEVPAAVTVRLLDAGSLADGEKNPGWRLPSTSKGSPAVGLAPYAVASIDLGSSAEGE